LENLFFIAKVVLPVFLLVIVGVALKLIKIVDEPFIKVSSQFVYRVSLPVLIFMKLHDVNIDRTFDSKMIAIIIFGTILIFLMGYLLAKLFKMEPQNEGVFVQGAFRSNYAIVGLAIILRMFGADALAKASFLLLFALPLYNLFGIMALVIPFSKSRKLNLKSTFKEITTNPLLIAVSIAILYSFLNWGLHSTIEITGNYIAQTALPLALIAIGAGLDMKSIREASVLAFGSSILKIIVSPLLIFFIAFSWGITGTDLGILLIIFGSPTAIASFVLAAGLNGNIKLAGNIIIISTLGSIVTIISGLFLLTYLELI